MNLSKVKAERDEKFFFVWLFEAKTTTLIVDFVRLADFDLENVLSLTALNMIDCDVDKLMNQMRKQRNFHSEVWWEDQRCGQTF